MLYNMGGEYLIFGDHYCLRFSDGAIEAQSGECLPKVTELASSRVGIWTQFILYQF